MEKTIYSAQEKILRNLLRQIRLDANLRQADLAQRLNEPQSFISKYESGERRLDIIELRNVCSSLGISLVDLVKRFERALDESK
ncbi:MAG TPA: helix-turn-helix transcriptional regulator [Planctomycetota bacterium]|nr:helix-turn-helix transcriptional regulator [Planctomycetota bacterium]